MNRTKQLISDALWQLLDERPYSRITVQNIVDRCQINRSTFYYHFSDIPAVLEYSVASWSERAVVRGIDDGEFPSDCVYPIVEECVRRKQACLNVYRSVHREEFLLHLNRAFSHMLNAYADQMLKKTDVPRDELDLLIWYTRCFLSGVILDWLDAGMSYDVTKRVRGLRFAAEGVAAAVWFRLPSPSEDGTLDRTN